VYEITTPENVRFRVERAGVASRALAWSLDVLIMGCLLQLGASVVAPLALLVGEAATALVLVIGFLVQWWYGALCEWRFAGRTVGKWLVGIATRDQQGLRLTLSQTVIRNLLRIMDLLPGLYLVGGCSALLDRHGRRLGDLAAGTLVVRERRPGLPARARAPRQSDLLLHPELVEVGQRLNPYERDAVLALAKERDDLPLELRLELFEALATHLERRFAVQRAAHLSAEKVVLYVAAVLAQPASAAPLPDRGAAQES
jgi:uncharacterized RDD family membrane protein YckC